MFDFLLKFTWNLFLRVQLTVCQHWLGLSFRAEQAAQAITWTNDGLILGRIVKLLI